MTGLVLIRHAETDMAGTFCGQSDPPVNARGHEQIAAMISSLASERFDEVYSSDLRRAVSTATSLAATLAAPVVTSIKLREIHFGDWEGLTWAEIEKRDPAHARRWIEQFPAIAAPNGEPVVAFESRVLSEIDRLLLPAKTRRLAVVTHGGVMRAVLRVRFGYTEQQAWELTKPFCSSFDCASAALTQEKHR